ncbi:hypothetical protein BGZ63DRAFT_62850 [Mariannaea sp. PMI_226]|nr:hypothetical protein BGZ63DRAFT_62850 [Mariannaea sp. PMI_226]
MNLIRQSPPHRLSNQGRKNDKKTRIENVQPQQARRLLLRAPFRNGSPPRLAQAITSDVSKEIERRYSKTSPPSHSIRQTLPSAIYPLTNEPFTDPSLSQSPMLQLNPASLDRQTNTRIACKHYPSFILVNLSRMPMPAIVLQSHLVPKFMNLLALPIITTTSKDEE